MHNQKTTKKRPRANAIDLNNDGLFDLLLADGGYPNVTALFNGGSHEKAKITHFDTNFPRQSVSVNLLNTPVVSTIDIDNCGTKELIFSPYNAREFSTESYASNWVYKKCVSSGDFHLQTKRFLQDEMLDFGMGSFPTIVDIDGNGLLDIVVGNYGKIDSVWLNIDVWNSRMVANLTLLKNIGTPTQPKFQIHPINLFPPLDFTGAVPTFGNLSGNGKLDLLMGTEDGRILWYEQQENPFNFVLKNPNILQQNIGAFLAPQLFDLNGDGRLDLVVGNYRTIWRDEHNRPYFKGSLHYFENQGTLENPEFVLITDSLGRVDVITNHDISNEGYTKPHFFRNAGTTHLFCGNKEGIILHYTDIDDNLFDGGTFFRMNDLVFVLNDEWKSVSEGSFTAVAVTDFNGDGFLDMVVGNHRGGLTIFFGTDQIPVKNEPIVETWHATSLRIYPNPTTDYLQITNYEWKSGDVIEIYNLSGKRVLSERINSPFTFHLSPFTLHISHLPNGFYILKIGDQIAKFVKN